MIWPFGKNKKRLSSTTTTLDHDELGFSDPSLGLGEGEDADDTGRREAQGFGEPSGEAAEPAAPVAELAPRFGSFSFGFGRTSSEMPVVSETSPDAEPVADVVRRIKRSNPRPAAIDLAALGLSPVPVPSLRETAVLYRMAALSASGRDPGRAAGLWEGYLELCPADAAAWCALGQSRLALGRCEAAWEAFVEAHQRDAGDPLTCAALGWLRARQGEHQDAARFFAAAAASDPENLDYLESLAGAQDRTGDALAATRTRQRIALLTAEPAT